MIGLVEVLEAFPVQLENNTVLYGENDLKSVLEIENMNQVFTKIKIKNADHLNILDNAHTLSTILKVVGK